MDVCGRHDHGGNTAIAPGYGYEFSGAFHEKTEFPIPSAFYMTFLGPLDFTHADGSVAVNIGRLEAQGAWDAVLNDQMLKLSAEPIDKSEIYPPRRAA